MKIIFVISNVRTRARPAEVRDFGTLVRDFNGGFFLVFRVVQSLEELVRYSSVFGSGWRLEYRSYFVAAQAVVWPENLTTIAGRF